MNRTTLTRTNVINAVLARYVDGAKNSGEGVYEIEGVRFNMGGWWEFTLAITGTAGADRVTFNLQL